MVDLCVVITKVFKGHEKRSIILEFGLNFCLDSRMNIPLSISVAPCPLPFEFSPRVPQLAKFYAVYLVHAHKCVRMALEIN